MVGEGGKEGWVTSAVSNAEAIQALALALSFKKVGTTREMWIVISEDVNSNMKRLLCQAFHGMVTISRDEISFHELTNVAWNVVAKIWCWKLTQCNKCVYLDPNHLVTKNCDKLFEYKEFSVINNGGIDTRKYCTLFVFKPSFATFKKLVHAVMGSIGETNTSSTDQLLEYFAKTRHIISGVSIENVSNEFDIGKKIIDSTILNFPTEPWLLNNGKEYGDATRYWLQIYFQDVLPFIKTHVDEAVLNFVNDIIELNKMPPEIKELYESEEQYQGTIAVVGMSCRFPGANNTAEYWKLLSEGREAIRKFPSERPFRGPPEAKEMEAGYLNCPIDEFDAKFFGISPREAALMDPQQRLLLEVTWECLEQAGINPQTLRDTETGVYVGIWQQDYERIILEAKREHEDTGDFLHVFLGNKYSATASRISFCLGLHGPAVAIESGCSSSLTGLHMACESLHHEETSLALVSGVNLILLPFDPFSGKGAEETGVVLSKDYRCKTFDESADGFVRAEACGVVALKRYEDAHRDGDNIMAIVKGTAVNNDGAGTSFGTPNEKAQERVYRAALKRAKVKPADVSFVEAHGTGTAVGDPIEMYAIGQAYSEGRKEPLLVGSVKTNIGHCEAAAGIASLIKVILCIQHETIPPHRNLKTLNPRINLDRIPAVIPMELTPWRAATKIAAISSFSMSATNAHAIIQEPPKLKISDPTSSSFEMITLSAKSEEALTELLERYVEFLKTNSSLPLKDIAYGVNIGRAHLPHRLAVVATNTQQLLSRLVNRNFTQGKASTLRAKVGFLFTGQGTQYFGMCKGMYETFSAFKRAMDQCDAMFKESLDQSLQWILFKDENALNQTLYCQPAIFCIEYCLTQLWKFFGLKPDYVLGHSVGEFAAAVCAGILTLEDGMKLVVTRSQLVNHLPSGSMIAVRASEEVTTNMINNFIKSHEKDGLWIDIAAINSKEEVVVSLNSSCAKLFESYCSNNGIKYIQIPSAHAFHSREMEPILSDFAKIAEKIPVGNPTCIYISGTLAKPMEAIEFGSQYWQRHLRDTVRFSDAVRVVLSDCKVLVEIGPQPVLLGLTMANADNTVGDVVYCPSLRRNEEPSSTFYTAMKKLYVSGINFDWTSAHGIRQKYMDLPMYPFQRQKFWIIDDAEDQDIENPILHPLLGKKFLSSVPEMIFCQSYHVKELKYIQDHSVLNHVVAPAAVMLEAFLAASREVLQCGSKNKSPITVENFVIQAALPLGKKCMIQTVVTSDKLNSNHTSDLSYKLTLDRKLEHHFDKWKRHATAQFTPSSKLPNETVLDLDMLKSTMEYKDSMVDTYKTSTEYGIDFGPPFQSIVSAWHNATDMLVEIHLPINHADYICHPIVLDAMIQACGFRELFTGNETDAKGTLCLPVSVRRFTWLSRAPSNIMFALISGTTGVLTLHNQNGEALAIMEGLELIRTTANTVVRSIREDSLDVPDFMCDRWRSALGKMDSRVDISKMIAPTADSALVGANKETMEGILREDTLVLIKIFNDNVFHSFCQVIQECQWPWPPNNEILELTQWKPMLPNSLNNGILGIFFYDLETRGYLTEISDKTYQVLRQLPTPSKSAEIIADNTEHARSLSTLLDVELNFIERFRTCFPLILENKMTPLNLFFPEDESDNAAQHFYKHSTMYNHQNTLVVSYFAESLSHYQNMASKDGILRVLEVGAGSGSTTVQCIDVLKKLNIPYHYTFTDISPLFLNEAKQRLGQGAEMTYKIFNIEKDPLVQGFSPDEFDVIIGVQVVHATARIDESLINLKKVLKVNGSLILGEGFKPNTAHCFTYGMLDGWWRFEDFRLNSKLTALLNEKQWAAALERTGFDSISSVPGFMVGVVSARNASQFEFTSKSENMKKWLVIDDSSELCDTLTKNLLQQGRKVMLNSTVCRNSLEVQDDSLNPEFENLEGVLILHTKFESSNIVDIQAHISATILYTLKNIECIERQHKTLPNLVVVTRGVYNIGDSEPGNPNGSTAWGMLKVFRNENPTIRISLVDLDRAPTPCESSQLFAHLWNQEDEFFVAFRQDKTFVLRLTYIRKSIPPIQLPNTDRYKFINPKSGAFTDIEIGPSSNEEPQEAEVQVEVRACALNFRDLFMVMKPEGFDLPGSDNDLLVGDSIGLDFSGVVVGVGPNVTRFQVGDEVFGITQNGALASHVMAPETRLMRMPPLMTFAQASTIPCAFTTAIVGLIDTANITASDRVLIHAASGGVGLAAIQVVKTIGAEIYATAGSKLKRAYLRNLGINYVYHSRNTSFGDEIERDTKGAGVTVVLNSLTGPNFKETSLRICSQGARFVEMAKMNIWKPDEVEALRPDVKYTIIDLSLKEYVNDTSTETTILAQNKLRKIEELVVSGTYSGLPYVSYPIYKVREAFHYFQTAKHIGKIVVQNPKCTVSDDTGRIEHKYLIYNAKSSYMITGGLGGIGVEVTKWMCSMGAQSIILVGRSLPSNTVQRLVDTWNKQGFSIVIIQADVGQYESCQRILETIKTIELPPLRGIMHAAGVISDTIVSKQTLENFEYVLKPKVYGAWFLHTLTLDYELEFFIMFSSLSGILGMLGQCSHASANRFLDALIDNRVSMGLPGTTVNWGGWSDVGVAARMGYTTEVFTGVRMFTPSQGIKALQKIMTSSPTQVAVSDVVDWNIVKSVFCQGRYLDEMKSVSQIGNKFEQFDYLVEEIKKAVSTEERQTKIQIYIEAVLKETLSLPPTDTLDIDQNFAELGVDSLMGMEMKNRFQSLIGDRTLSISSMQENRTIRSLAAHISHLLENEPFDTRPVHELINEDIILPPDVCPAEIPAQLPSQFKHVLLTGATGHLGIHCLDQLLQAPQGLTVHCLIRGKSDAEANEKLKAALKRYKITVSNMGAISILAGDITLDKLGLAPETYTNLAECVDGIIHCAAKVNHVDKYSDGTQHDMRTHNVIGVRNVLKFASCRKTKPLLFASTLFAASKIAESGLLAEEYPEKDDVGEKIKWGYLLSKFIAEKLVQEAMERGIPVTTIRFPVILGHSKTGYMPPGYNHLWSILMASVRIRKIPEGRINGIPIISVDSAARVSTELFLNEAAERNVYNLTVDGPTLSEELFNEGLSEYGISCEVVSFKEWRDAAFEEHDVSLLGPLKSLYQDENQESAIFSIHSLSRETQKINISTFSPNMVKNFPDVANYVTSPELVVSRQFRAHFNIEINDSLE